MPRRRLLLLVIALAGLLAAVPDGAARVPVAAAVGGLPLVPVPSPADPIPIRRAFLSSESDPRLTAEPGGLRRLSIADFDARLLLAAREVAARAAPPRIQKATYRIAYTPGQLSGTAEWGVATLHGRPAAIPLDPFGLAAGAAKWADGRAALLFHEAARTHLWADDPAGGTVTVPWSLRGADAADDERFEIAAPPVPVAVWELRLPDDRAPAVETAGVLLTGPFPADKKNESLWRIAAGGIPRWEMTVRRPSATGEAVPIRASRSTKYALAPGTATATVEFRLESPRRPLREWSFDLDPRWKVTEVGGDPLDFLPVKDGKLKVTLRTAATTARVVIGVTDDLPAGPTAWPCPQVKVVGGTVAADAIEVSLHPDLRLDGWTPGDFRVSTAGVPPDRGYRIGFVGTLTATEGDRRQPVVRVRPAEFAVATEETLEWRLDPGRNRLTARVIATAVRGPIPTVGVQLGAGYAVEGVTATPDDPGLTWTAVASNTWTVEPSRPLGTGQSVELRFDVRGPPAPFAGDPAMGEKLNTLFPVPKFAVLPAAERSGSLRVTAGGGLRAVLPVKGPKPEDAGTIAFRGKEPDGAVTLTAPRPTVALTAMELNGSEKTASVRLTGRATDVPISSLTVFVPTVATATVKADDSAARVQRLSGVGPVGWTPLLTARNGWSAVAVAGLPDAVPGGVWRITFAAPQKGDFGLTVDGLPVSRDPAGRPSLVLPVVCGADATAAVVRGSGLRCSDDEFRSAATAFPPRVPLRMFEPVGVPVGSKEWRFDGVSLTTSVAGDGGMTVTLSGTVASAGGSVVPVELPPGAAVESTSVGGKRLTRAALSDNALSLPLPAAGDRSFEVRYRLPASRGWVAWRCESPSPGLPGDPPAARLWAFDGGGAPWPSLAGGSAPEPRDTDCVWVLPAGAIRGLAWGLAAVLGGLALALVRVEGRGLKPFAAHGLVLGVAVWAAPGGWSDVLRPGFAAVAAGVVGIIVVRPARRHGAAATAALFLATAGVAQAPEPVTVFLVPDPAGDTAKLRVFAPAAVLDRLDRLAAPVLPAVVIEAAEYDGTAGDGTATVDAKFLVLATRGGAHQLSLPLTGVRLERATLNGTDAFPEAPDATRFLVAIPAAGRHELRLRFAVPVVARGAEREARFGVPEVPACSVAFLAGATGRQPEVVTRRGGQKVLPTGTGPRAEADHGGGETVAVRWRVGGTGEAKPAVAVRDAGVWEIGEPDAAVTSAFAYRVTGGAVDRVNIEVPDSLDVTKVQVRAADPLFSAGVSLRSWTTGPPRNGGLPLAVRLQEPAEGRFWVIVTARPKRPLTTRPVLRFPRSADVAEADRDSFHAVRLTGVRADGVGLSGAVDFPADPVLREFALTELNWDRPGLARVVRRAPNAVAELRPALLTVPAFTAGASEAVATVGPTVEIDALMRAANPDAVAAEFDVPGGAKAFDVRGTGLAGWAQSGSRVQAWFRQPTPNAAVRWSVSLPGGIVPGGKLPADGVAVEVPWPRWPSSVAATAEPLRVTFRPAGGFEISPLAVVGGQPVAGGAAGEFTYTVEPGTHPPAKFLLKRSRPNPPKPPDPVKPKPPDPVPAAPNTGPAPPTADATDPSPLWQPLVVLGWCAAYFGFVALALVGRHFRPESAAGVAGLSALAVGWSSVFGVVLLAAASVGVLMRASWLALRLWGRVAG